MGTQTHGQTLCGSECLNWNFLSVPSIGAQETLQKKWGGKNLGVSGNDGVEDTRMWHIDSSKQGSHRLTETDAGSLGPAWVCTMFSAYMLVFWWNS